MRILIGTQLLAAVVASIVAFNMVATSGMLALIYGASIGVLITLLVRRSTDKALETAVENPGHGVVVMFSGFALRYAVAILGLLIGFKTLKLMAVPMIAGFILMIIVQVFISFRVSN